VTTARVIIRNALTFGLNRLSPGEQEDADLFGRCLDALGSIVDEMNGGKGMLWREVLTASSAITGASAQLGVAWAGLASGDEILGATVSSGGQDVPMDPLTMGQYADISDKTSSGQPRQYAHDGAATVYLYPAAAGHVVTLRTKQAAQTFADLTTDYVMPAGYQSALEAFVAEKMAPTLNTDMVPLTIRRATAARMRLASQTIYPAILGDRRSGNILTGWR
jgi:hypothetical protein